MPRGDASAAAQPRLLSARLWRLVSFLLIWFSVVIGLLWVLVRAFGEASRHTQVLAWIPIEVPFLFAVVALGPSFLARRVMRNRSSQVPRWGICASLLATLAMGFGVAFGSWSLHRLPMVMSYHARVESDPEVFSVAFLNLSAKPNLSWGAYSKQTDVVVLVNPMWGQDLEPAWAWVAGQPDERDAARFGFCTLLTRQRIVRHATLWLDFDGLWPGGIEPERGWVSFVELIDSADRPVVLWVIDMPSSPWLPKTDAMRHLLEEVRKWQGQAIVIGDAGLPTLQQTNGFPMPDLIVGDFNVPRWSASIHEIEDSSVLNMREVSQAVGFGPPGTFPAPWSVLPIDLAFTGQGWEPIHHTTQALLGVRHRVITAWVRRTR